MKSIDDLIAASSIGEGLRDIAARGADAHAADLDIATPKAKRRKVTSPTARSLAELRKRGWPAGVVEKNVRFPSPHKVDLFGVIDLIAIVRPAPTGLVIDGVMQLSAGAILAIQACSGGRTGANGRGSDHAARRAKILAEPRAQNWVEAGGRLELWSWSQRVSRKKDGSKAARPAWTLRVETYAEMLAAASEGT